MTPPRTFSRTDTSFLGKWWWTVDHATLICLLTLVAIGVFLSMTASPQVARHLGFGSFHFTYRHIAVVIVSIIEILAFSMASPRLCRRVALITLLGTLVALIATPLIGTEIKGARRWINLGGFSLQASEFLKPAFAVVSGWLLALSKERPDFPGFTTTLGLYVISAGLLMAQPDFGMTFMLTLIWMAQLFVSGFSIIWFVLLALISAISLAGAYFLFPHVASRIDRFLDPSTGDSYQVDRSLEAFTQGGFLGQGPGEGLVKQHLPDAHADFVFAVAGEEFGFILCAAILALFAIVTVRCLQRAHHQTNLFLLYSAVGLTTQFALQSLINIGSSLHLIPTKGMTLPFISYGGSSLLGCGMAMGMVLCFTRRRPNVVEPL